jgi:hypothetical protein
MEQKKINDLSKQYQQNYEQSKLKYEVAKVFFYNIPFWKYVISIFLFITAMFSYELGHIVRNNQMYVIPLLLLNCICFYISLPIIMIPIMNWSKTDTKYFDTVLNQINHKFKSKSIELKETGSTQQKQVKIVVNKILNTLNNNDQIISYLDVYNIYKQYRNEFIRDKNYLKNLDNDIDIIIKKQKQKENIQKYIKEHM